MKIKIKKVIFASVITFGLVGATFGSASNAEASSCSSKSAQIIVCWA
ncbi:hypothetical protein MKY15_07995 [Sporosarcina sp. FSL K6-1540]